MSLVWPSFKAQKIFLKAVSRNYEQKNETKQSQYKWNQLFSNEILVRIIILFLY